MRGAKLESARFDRPFELDLEFPFHVQCYENCRENGIKRKKGIIFIRICLIMYIYIITI